MWRQLPRTILFFLRVWKRRHPKGGRIDARTTWKIAKIVAREVKNGTKAEVWKVKVSTTQGVLCKIQERPDQGDPQD